MGGRQHILYLNHYKISQPGWILADEKKKKKKALNPVKYFIVNFPQIFLTFPLSVQDYVVCPELIGSQWKYWNKDLKEFAPYNNTGSAIKCAAS